MEIVYHSGLNRLIHQFTLNFHDRGDGVDLLFYPLFLFFTIFRYSNVHGKGAFLEE